MQELNEKPFTQVAVEYVLKNMDSRARFTPVSDVARLVLIKAFETNFTSYTFFVSILGIISSFIFFLSFRKAGFSLLQSFLSGLMLLSGQYVICWSDISNYESICMLLLSLTIFFCIKSCISQKNSDKMFFVIFLFLTALSKENFILLIPALLLIYLKIYSKRNKVNHGKAFKENLKFSCLILLLMIINLLLIYFIVGIDKQRYAGIDFGKIGLQVIPGFAAEVLNYTISIFLITGMIVVTFYAVHHYKKNPENNKQIFKDVLFAIVLFVLISFPQYIIHLKTGLTGRYSLLFCMGMNVLLILILRVITDSKYIQKFVKAVFILLAFTYIVYEVKTTSIPQLTNFSRFCKSNTAMINKLKGSYNKELLIVMDPVSHFHFVYSLKMYLNYLKADKDYKYQFVKAQNYTPFQRDTSVIRMYTEKATNDFKNLMLDSAGIKDNLKEILIFGELKDKFLNKNRLWFKEYDFNHEKIGMYTLYFRK